MERRQTGNKRPTPNGQSGNPRAQRKLAQGRPAQGRTAQIRPAQSRSAQGNPAQDRAAQSSCSTVAPARSFKRPEERKGPKIAIVIAGAIAVLALAAVGIVSVIGNFNSNVQKAERVTLTTERIESDLKGVTLELPDLEPYHYISTTNLIGPKYADIVIGEVEETGGSDDTVVRMVTVNASYKNKSILVTIPLTVAYLYSPAEETWEMGELTQEEATVEPSDAPSASTIMADLDALLEPIGSSVASKYEGCQVSTTSELTAEGGTINASLLKTSGRNTHSAEVKVTVTWSETEGWVAKAELLSDETAHDAAPSTKLECSSGDTIQIKGTVSTSSSSSRLVLVLDQETELIIDGDSHDIKELSLDVNLEDDGASLVGKRVTVTGMITTGLSTRTSPAGVAATNITLG